MLKERSKDKMLCMLFWAKWYPECTVLRMEMHRLAGVLSHLTMTWCDVDVDKDIVSRYEITKVPFMLLMHVSPPLS